MRMSSAVPPTSILPAIATEGDSDVDLAVRGRMDGDGSVQPEFASLARFGKGGRDGTFRPAAFFAQ
jgi:hypothetical protein